MRIYAIIAAIWLSACASTEEKGATREQGVPASGPATVSNDTLIMQPSSSDVLQLLPLSEKLNLCAEIEEQSESIIQRWNAILKLSGVRFMNELNRFLDEHGIFDEFSTVGRHFSVLNEGACGETYITFAKINTKNSEPVYELDSKGKILRRWAAPIGSGQSVVGVQGDQLIVQSVLPSVCVGEGAESTGRPLGDYEKSVHLTIGPSGKIKVIETVEPQDLPIGAPCSIIGEKSEYSFCRQVKDANKKTTHRISFEGECT